MSKILLNITTTTNNNNSNNNNNNNNNNNDNDNHNAQSFWDVPLFEEHQEVRANRVDARIINHESKRVITLEKSCPWITNREKKEDEKPRNTDRCKL